MTKPRKRDIVGLDPALKVKPGGAHKRQFSGLAVDNILEFKLFFLRLSYYAVTVRKQLVGVWLTSRSRLIPIPSSLFSSKFLIR